MLKLKELTLTLEDFQSTDIRRRRQTLGQLKAALLGTFAFSEEFEQQFNRFVGDRNQFIHTFWVGETKIDPRVGLPSEDHFTEKLGAMFSLMSQARDTEFVFRGLFSSIGEAFPEQAKSQESRFPWKRYIPNFKATLRGSQN